MKESYLFYSQCRPVGTHSEVKNSQLIKSNKKQPEKNFFSRKLLDVWVADMMINTLHSVYFALRY